MYHGYTESAEKIARRKARICAGVNAPLASVATIAEAKPSTLFDDLLQTIAQARGELDIRKLYAFMVSQD